MTAEQIKAEREAAEYGEDFGDVMVAFGDWMDDFIDRVLPELERKLPALVRNVVTQSGYNLSILN